MWPLRSSVLSTRRSRVYCVRSIRHFALREVQDAAVELAQPVGGQRAAVRALEVAQHPLLALRVDEADAVRLLVALQARDELEPLVQRLHQLAVVVGDR